jgi:uncharacterized repeat protein (TIGR03943 family)
VIVTRRLVQALPPIAWSGFLAWLWLSGSVVRYVGARTSWVVPFGAVVLGLVGLAQLLRLRGHRQVAGGLRRSDLFGALVLVLPILAVLAAPTAELGAYAARQKAPLPPTQSTARRAVPVKHELSMSDLHYATQYDDTASTVGAVPGTRVDIAGFVTHPSSGRPGTFAVTRFVIWCCIADAKAYSAQVDAKGLRRFAYRDNVWVRVIGTTAQRGRRLIVRASTVTRIPRPRSPYLTG